MSKAEDRDASVRSPSSPGASTTPAGCAGLGLFTLLWDGGLGTLLFFIQQAHATVPLFAWVILSLLIVVGALLLIGCGYVVIATVGQARTLDRPTVTVTPYEVYAGQPITVTYQQRFRRAATVEYLTVKLILRGTGRGSNDKVVQTLGGRTGTLLRGKGSTKCLRSRCRKMPCP